MQRTEALKQVYDLALGTGRSWQNSQTGWIHYCYNLADEEAHFPIPVYENLLFVLSLMRSKVGDNIQEAKGILEKLIPFQTQCFPVYLHEYPETRDKWLGIQLLPVYAEIFLGFHQILGSTLKQKLEISLNKLVEFTFAGFGEKGPPYHYCIKFGGTLVALGRHFQNQEWTDKGNALLQEAFENPDRRAWFSPSMMGDMLLGLQLAYPKIEDSIWGDQWITTCEAWSVKIGAYAGPSWKEFQIKEETQTTLYDLYMSVYTGSFPYRAFIDDLIQLQGALIMETSELFPARKEQIRKESWFVIQKEKYTFGVMSKMEIVPPGWEKGFVPFKALWGDLNRYRSLVMQGGNCKTIAYDVKERGIDLILELDEPSDKDDREKNREICFFTEIIEGDQILVSGASATTFKLRDQVTLHSQDRHFQLVFQLIQGSGEFMGHIMRGNRPSQIGLKGKQKVEAFDWMIFLRSVRRSGTCRFLVSIST